MIFNVGIVEDDKDSAKKLAELLAEFGKENDCEFSVAVFSDAESLSPCDGAAYDVLFLDIELPGTDGMTAAAAIRAKAPDVIIIFITNVARLAVRGYTVSALDYIVKPVDREVFFAAVRRAVSSIERGRGISVAVGSTDGTVCLDSASITYIEAFGHNLIYHTGTSSVSEWSSLKKPEKALCEKGFARCNSCYLVNLRYVRDIDGDFVYVAGDKLKISRPKRKSFLHALNTYLGK